MGSLWLQVRARESMNRFSAGSDGWPRVLKPLILLVYLAVVFGPLLALAAQLTAGGVQGRAAWLLALPSGRRLGLLCRSLGLAAGVALGGTLVGVLCALSLWRRRSGAARHFRWLILVFAAVPAYIHALAWNSFTHVTGTRLEALGLGSLALEGWVGSWWVQVMACLPIATGLCLMGLELVDQELIEAARLLRSDLAVLARVVLPLAAPAILAGAALLFVISLADYSVPSLYGLNVYSLEIFAAYSANHDARGALLLAAPLLAVSIAAVLLLVSALRSAAAVSRRPRRDLPPMAWPGWLEGSIGLAAILAAAQMLVPGIGLILSAGSVTRLAHTISVAAPEISFTAWIGLITAVACLPMAFAAASELLRPDWRGRLWWLLVTLPLAVPGPLIGIGLIAMWNAPAFPVPYVSDWMPVLAALARFTPPAALVALIQMRRLDPLLSDAARVHQRHPFQGLTAIQIPMLAPGLLASAGLAFALALAELGATLITVPPGKSTLAIRIYNYLHYGASESVAGLCLVMAAAAIFAAVLALGALAAWRRMFIGLPGGEPIRR